MRVGRSGRFREGRDHGLFGLACRGKRVQTVALQEACLCLPHPVEGVEQKVSVFPARPRQLIQYPGGNGWVFGGRYRRRSVAVAGFDELVEVCGVDRQNCQGETRATTLARNSLTTTDRGLALPGDPGRRPVRFRSWWLTLGMRGQTSDRRQREGE